MDAGRQLTPEEQGREWARCEASPIYFIREYCWILNVNEEAWVPFDLWPAQAWSLAQMHRNRQVVIPCGNGCLRGGSVARQRRRIEQCLRSLRFNLLGLLVQEKP